MHCTSASSTCEGWQWCFDNLKCAESVHSLPCMIYRSWFQVVERSWAHPCYGGTLGLWVFAFEPSICLERHAAQLPELHWSTLHIVCGSLLRPAIFGQLTPVAHFGWDQKGLAPKSPLGAKPSTCRLRAARMSVLFCGSAFLQVGLRSTLSGWARGTPSSLGVRGRLEPLAYCGGIAWTMLTPTARHEA